jgi:hypothetical protein
MRQMCSSRLDFPTRLHVSSPGQAWSWTNSSTPLGKACMMGQLLTWAVGIFGVSRGEGEGQRDCLVGAGSTSGLVCG